MAFLTDPSISQQVQTPNLAQVYLQAQQLKGMQQEQQLRSLSLAQATQSMKDNQDLRTAYSQSGGDPNGAVAALKTSNPYVAQQESVRVSKAQKDAEDAALKVQKAKLENTAAQTQGFASLLDGVKDANDYQARIQTAVQKGFINPEEVQHIPPYSPEAVQQLQSAALTHNQQITAQLQQHNAAETARHNGQTEATAAATQAETAKYHTAEIKDRQGNLALRGAEFRQRQQSQNFDQDSSIDAQAQQIANGDLPAPPLSRSNPRNTALWKRALEINPKLSTSLYTATQDLRSSKPNSMGGNVGRLGTAILHGDRALQNSNGLGFSEGLLTGVSTSGTSAYKQDAEFLTGEIGQYVTGGKLTVDEGKKLSSDLMSSRQGVRDSAIHEIIRLSKGKLQNQMQQFKNATQNDFPTDRVFNDPEVSGALHKHGVIDGPAPQGVKAGPPPGATHIVPGSDGKMHYTDGKNDLGVAQ